MKPFKALTATGQSRRLRQVAQAVLAHYPLEDVRLRLVHYGENSAWEVRARDTRGVGDERRYLLRVHRPGHRSAAIRSELAWMRALREEAGVATPGVIETLEGKLLANGRGKGVVGGRKAVLFEWIEGAMRSSTTVGPRTMWRIGELAGRMHLHALSWTPPEEFQRPRWDLAGLIGEEARYGSPLEVPGLRGRERRLVERLIEAVTEDLEDFGEADDDVCLIHADLCLANVLFIGERAHPIDFDDSGIGHRLYDIAVSFKNLIGRERFAPLHAAYQQGYWSVAHDYHWEPEELMPFLMARYLAELAWHGSRSDHPDVREDLPDAIAFVADHAEEYLAARG